MPFAISPVVLEGIGVRLEPLCMNHAAELYAIGQEQDDWQYMPRGAFESLEDTHQWIEAAQQLAATGEHISFTIIDTHSNRVAGSSRYLSIRPAHKGLEIGYTWLGREFQRSHVNTAAKLCLLSQAFDTLKALRVELKCDSRNERSQSAITRLGATREGVFRKHMIVRNDFVRDSVYFSIIDSEWPHIKRRLRQQLDAQ